MSYELRPRPSQQLDPINDPSKLALWEQSINPRIEAWGVNMKLPNVSPHPYTDLAHEVFIIDNKRISGAASKEVFEKVIEQESKNNNSIILNGLQCNMDGDFC